MINSNFFMMVHSQYHILKIILSVIKIHETVTDNPLISICLIKSHLKGITFKIKTKYYLEYLTPETMKSFASNKEKINKVYF